MAAAADRPSRLRLIAAAVVERKGLLMVEKVANAVAVDTSKTRPIPRLISDWKLLWHSMLDWIHRETMVDHQRPMVFRYRREPLSIQGMD